MKWLAVYKMVVGAGPAFWLMADAFSYGVKTYGDGTWRQQTSGEHIDEALRKLADWRQGVKDWHALVDAALRLAFAIALVVPHGAEYKR